MKLYDDRRRRKLWAVRESGLGATASSPARTTRGEGWEDSAVPPERVGDYLRELPQALEKYGYAAPCTATSARAASTRGSTST